MHISLSSRDRFANSSIEIHTGFEVLSLGIIKSSMCEIKFKKISGADQKFR